ncbi:tryptophan--tRNA ligase, mitochondrial-like isoform X2 [Centruroides sculpturatus]|nr:tryptophan--tRNA ligase, mitochondrial-like isoform X2 [Centruroides sculpturatus]
MTTDYNAEILRENIFTMTACLLACGIDPEKCILFLQSEVPQHTQLAWILGCLTTLPRLSRLPQYKEKTEKLKDIPLGLFIYPVLQAADILLYKSNVVPIGEDQIHHIQLAHHLAHLFNNKFQNIFPYPKPFYDVKVARIKSLKFPDKKMSKSEINPIGRIDLTDSPELITKKIKRAVTDFTSEVTFDPKIRPGVSNLITIHSLFTGLTVEEICARNEGIETAQYKLILAENIIEVLKPIQKKIQEFMTDKSYLCEVLNKGTEMAKSLAMQTIEEVSQIVSLNTNYILNKNNQNFINVVKEK